MATGAQLFFSKKARARREELARQRRDKLERGKRVSRGERRATIQRVRQKQTEAGVQNVRAPTVEAAPSRFVQQGTPVSQAREQVKAQAVQTKQTQSVARQQLQSTRTPTTDTITSQSAQSQRGFFGRIVSFFRPVQEKEIEVRGRIGRTTQVRTERTTSGFKSFVEGFREPIKETSKQGLGFGFNTLFVRKAVKDDSILTRAAELKRETEAEFVVGTLKNPAKTAVEFGVGAGLGAAFKGASIAARGGARVLQGANLVKSAAVVEKGFAVGSAGLLGAGVVEGGRQIAAAPTTRARAEVIASQARGLAGFGAGTKATQKAIDVAERGLFGTFGTFVPKETVFDPKVLSGKQKFPTAKSPQESLRLFQESKTPSGKIEVISSTPEQFTRTTTIRKGGQPDPKTGKPTEDVGLFITPARRASGEGLGSARFLRIGQKPQSIGSLRDIPKSFTFAPEPQSLPAGIRFQLDKVVAAPRRTVTAVKATGGKDFTATESLQSSLRGTGTGVQTVRSTLRQTSEIEANIPFGQKVTSLETSLFGRVAGSKEFTVVKGKVVRLPRFKVEKTQPTPREVIGGPKVQQPIRTTKTTRQVVSSFGGTKQTQIRPSVSSSLRRSSSNVISRPSSKATSFTNVVPSSATSGLGRSQSSLISQPISRTSGTSSGSSFTSGFSGFTSGVSRGGSGISIVRQTTTKRPFLFKRRKTRPVKSQKENTFSFERNLRNTPTAFAAGLNVFGQRTTGGTKSGLGGRLLQKQPKKKKKSRFLDL